MSDHSEVSDERYLLPPSPNADPSSGSFTDCSCSCSSLVGCMGSMSPSWSSSDRLLQYDHHLSINSTGSIGELYALHEKTIASNVVCGSGSTTTEPASGSNGVGCSRKWVNTVLKKMVMGIRERRNVKSGDAINWGRRRPAVNLSFKYDIVSYSQNFDDGCSIRERALSMHDPSPQVRSID